MTGERFREILEQYVPIPEENIPKEIAMVWHIMQERRISKESWRRAITSLYSQLGKCPSCDLRGEVRCGSHSIVQKQQGDARMSETLDNACIFNDHTVAPLSSMHFSTSNAKGWKYSVLPSVSFKTQLRLTTPTPPWSLLYSQCLVSRGCYHNLIIYTRVRCQECAKLFSKKSQCPGRG
jgi:hypothetical protein